MQNISLNNSILQTSRSGRLLIPRLRCWLGERIVVNKGEVTIIDDGIPDYTGTFMSERASTSLSQTLGSSNGKKLDSTSSPAMAKTQTRRQTEKQQGSISKNAFTDIKQRKTKTSCSPKNPAVSPTNSAKRKRTPKKKVGTTHKKKTPVKTIAKVPEKKTLKKSPQKKNVGTTHKKKTPEKTIAKVPERKTLKKSPQKKLNVENCGVSIDIMDPQFQPYVLLRRLLPKEICLRPTVTPVKKLIANSVSPLFRPRPRTIKETQIVLRKLHNNKTAAENGEDEAAATEDYFKQSYTPSQSKTMRMVTAAADILNDDFGESEDNLSIRTLSERESSPVSFAVSPVGSVHETDTECSFEDGLLTGSPHLNSPASYHTARLVHRAVADKTKLQKSKNGRKRQKKDKNDEAATTTNRIPPKSLAAAQLFRPKVMKALEKDLKKKNQSSKPWDYSAYYNGNLLHISVNSDSDTSEDEFFDSMDSLSTEF